MSPFNEMICRVFFSSNFLEVEFHHLHFCVPLSYVESSKFSFCGLYCHLVTFSGINHSSLLVHHHPLWLHAMSNDFLTHLSVLPLSHLNDVMQPLKLFPLCPKTTAMQVIVNNVLQEQAHFTSCDSSCSMFLPLLISHHFNS